MKTPPHPHLIPAVRNWMLETFEVVHLHVLAERVTDPFLQDYANDGVIVLSVGPAAVPFFNVTSDTVSFASRFNGVKREIAIPPTAVMNIVGFNKGQESERHFFPLPNWQEDETPAEPERKRPNLSVVK